MRDYTYAFPLQFVTRQLHNYCDISKTLDASERTIFVIIHRHSHRQTHRQTHRRRDERHTSQRLHLAMFRNPTNTITISGFAFYVTTSCVYANRYSYDANRFHD